MEPNREIKNMMAVMALVAAMAFGVNALVVPGADHSFIAWALGLFIAAALLWLWMRRDALAEKHSQAMKAAEEAASQAEALAKQARDQTEAEPGADEPDDLSRIVGVGPVYQQLLKDAGLETFADIAGKSLDELEAIVKAAGRARPASIETWAEQAAYAAKGDWEGLQTFQDSLDSGRRP